jgi:hypothetical protein
MPEGLAGRTVKVFVGWIRLFPSDVFAGEECSNIARLFHDAPKHWKTVRGLGFRLDDIL